jgi:hypothetical protein
MKSNYIADDFDKKGSNDITSTLIMPNTTLEPKDYISVHISNCRVPISCSKSHKPGNYRNLVDSVLVTSEHRLSLSVTLTLVIMSSSLTPEISVMPLPRDGSPQLPHPVCRMTHLGHSFPEEQGLLLDRVHLSILGKSG